MEAKLERYLRNGLTVDELISELQDMSEDGMGNHKVGFTYNYGDHWRTQVVQRIQTVDEQEVEYSDYHSMAKLKSENSEDENEDDRIKSENVMVVLST